MLERQRGNHGGRRGPLLTRVDRATWHSVRSHYPVPKFIHFRSTDELEELLDGEVEALKAAGVPKNLSNRSVVARSILTAYLGCGAAERLRDAEGRALDGGEAQVGLTRAAAREVLRNVSGATESAITRAIADALERVPTYLQEAIAEAEG